MIIRFTLTAETNLVLGIKKRSKRNIERVLLVGDRYAFHEMETGTTFTVEMATPKDIQIEKNMRSHRFEMSKDPTELNRV